MKKNKKHHWTARDEGEAELQWADAVDGASEFRAWTQLTRIRSQLPSSYYHHAE